MTDGEGPSIGLSFEEIVEVEAAVLKQVEDEFEAFGTGIVGVGHGVVAGVNAGKECLHRHNFGLLLGSESHGLEVADVAVVHADDEVEVGEVGESDAATHMSEVVAPAPGVEPHA